jgi:hypothetical protein
MAMWKKIAVACGLLMVILGGVAVWSYASPWLIMSRIQAAAMKSDAQTLNKLIDWGSVRDKLTVNWGRRTLIAARMEPNDERVSQVVLSVETMVGKLVTPDNLSKLYQQAKGSGEKLLIKGAYMNLGSYIFAVENQTTKTAITVVLKRQGPGSWKVVEVILLDPKLISAGG